MVNVNTIKLLFWIFTFTLILDSESVYADDILKLVRKVDASYTLIDNGLYKDSLGNLYFNVSTEPGNVVLSRAIFSDEKDPRELKNVVDVDTFGQYYDIYYTDKNNVYCFDKMAETGVLVLLDNETPARFKISEKNKLWAISDKFAYYMCTRVDVDIKSFSVIEITSPLVRPWFAKDNKHYYFMEKRVSRELLMEEAKKLEGSKWEKETMRALNTLLKK